LNMGLLRQILHLLFCAVSRLSILLIRCFSVFSRKYAVPVPPLDPLLLTPAYVLAERIRNRELRSVVLVQAFIARIRQVNSVLNAVVCDRFDDAIREAQSADEFLSSGTEDKETLRERFPLLGVPFTVKEAFGVQGMPQSSGLLSRKLIVSETDAVVVSRMKKAGAIPIGVTNCSELCMWYESSNKVYGKTRNPYNPQHIVGGSSGGEGCILATAGSVIGVGSDIGGSIRMPAFFNGIYGHKPTPGLVPNEGQFPNAHGCRSEFLCTGPMCRYASDLPLVLKVMAGEKTVGRSLDQEVSLQSLRYFSMENDGGGLFVSAVDDELVQAQRQLVGYIEKDLKAHVQTVNIHNLRYSFEIWSAMMSSDDKGETFADLLSSDKLWPCWELLKWTFGFSKHTLPAIGLALTEKLAKINTEGNKRMMQKAKLLKEEISSLLGDDGILIYPSHPKIAPRHHEPLAMAFNFAYTGIFNILGFPVTQCPLGLSTTGLPLGFQLIASHNNDHLTLALAQHLEKALGGWKPPQA
uniref:Amidase domain-containing protein n=1 Tax=Leptobrachium leishanense TaxID=445787 RepID=A0A8C5WAL8_9ANUR